METKEFLKKYWFVGLVAVLLLGFLGYYAVEEYNNREKTATKKSIDGKDLIYSINGEGFTADELYDAVYTTQGNDLAFKLYLDKVVDKAIELTDDMKTQTKQLVLGNLQSYTSSTGSEEEAKKQIGDALKQMGYRGYEDFEKYFYQYFKEQKMLQDYALENPDEVKDVLKTINDEKKPRNVSHILISVADVQSITEDENAVFTASLTDDEQAKFDKVKELLANGTSFEEIAKEYSDDTGSAENGGVIGLVTTDDSTTYVTEFYNGVYATEVGEVSDAVLSEYGYHFIKVEEVTDEEIIKNDIFYSIVANDEELYIKIVKSYADKLNIEIIDENLKTYIDEKYGAEE